MNRSPFPTRWIWRIVPWLAWSSCLGQTPELLRFAFSARMFSEVNRNDAQASVKAWALALARERNLPMETQPVVLDGVEPLRDALTRPSIEGAVVTAVEYFTLDPVLRGTNIFVSLTGKQATDEYVLLVRGDSGITNLAGLEGKSLMLLESPRACLAPLWLDVTLADQKLKRTLDHFGTVTRATKLMRVATPVFFRQADACLLTRRGYEVMCEMNLQMRTQLRAIASSPPLVPVVSFFRPGYDAPLREQLFVALRDIERTPSGAQVLTLFQCEQLTQANTNMLASAAALFEAHRRLGLPYGDSSGITQGQPSNPGGRQHSP